MRVQDSAIIPAAALAAVSGSPSGETVPWSPGRAALTTRWAEGVSPDNVHPEYPRPQLVRSPWLNLNGLWQFAPAGEHEDPPFGKDPGRRILVPFPMESALSGITEHHERSWYRRLFEIPGPWRGRRILLHFGAVDWECRVFVNGRLLRTHRGGYDPFTVDITDALADGGVQELILGIYDPTDRGSQPRGKQVLEPGNIWYTPVSGVWQTVWLEPVAETHIDAVHLVPDVDAESLRVRVDVAHPTPETTVRLTVAPDGASREYWILPNAESAVPVRNPRLWSPADPFLYDLRIEVVQDGRTVDEAHSYFGMRKIEVRRRDGVPRILLNGEPLFQNGPLDQGFWPDGLYTAPSDDALRYDIETTKRFGFNMIRKHVKVEPERWYAWCDRLGLLVWQDMPNGDNRTPESREGFESELRRMIETLGNHPSIVLWVVFNEGWGQYDTERITRRVAGWDPSRLVTNASGWTDRPDAGDVVDIHVYPGPAAPPVEERRAGVLGEYGGLGLAVPGHTWTRENWGYQQIPDPESLTRRYATLLRRVWELQAESGLCAAVYTQITDVETECNGLLTYDRAVVKVDPERIAPINRVAVPAVIRIAPTAETEPVEWRYTFDAPAGDWTAPGFDDSAWTTGRAGFGTEGTPDARVGTVWNTPDIWIRRGFTLPDPVPGDLVLRLHHDEDAEIYINGVRAAEIGGFSKTYEYIPIAAEALASLRPGRNLLAAHARQRRGGQYLDVGIAAFEKQP